MTTEVERYRLRILATAEQQAGELLADAAHRTARRMEAAAADRSAASAARAARGADVLRRLLVDTQVALQSNASRVVAALSAAEGRTLRALDGAERRLSVVDPAPPEPFPSYFDELRALLDARP